MSRNLRALSVALVTVFAMSGELASSAHAVVKMTTGFSQAILTMSSIGSQKFTINPNSAEPAGIACTGASGSATVNTGDTWVTYTGVSYSGCTATIGANTLPATVDMEGCYYEFHGGLQNFEDHFSGGAMYMNCTKALTGPVLTIFSDASHKTRICKYTLWTFNGHFEITYTGTTSNPDDVDLNAIHVPIESTRNEGILCPKPKESAVYNGELTLKAFVDVSGSEGAQIALTVSE